MAAEMMHLTIAPGFEIRLGPQGGMAASALIRISGEARESPASVSSDTACALEVSLSRDCLRSLLGGDSVAFRHALGGASRENDIRIPVEAAALVRRISDDIRSTPHRKGARTLYLQGKVLELLATVLGEPSDPWPERGGP